RLDDLTPGSRCSLAATSTFGPVGRSLSAIFPLGVGGGNHSPDHGRRHVAPALQRFRDSADVCTPDDRPVPGHAGSVFTRLPVAGPATATRRGGAKLVGWRCHAWPHTASGGLEPHAWLGTDGDCRRQATAVTAFRASSSQVTRKRSPEAAHYCICASTAASTRRLIARPSSVSLS